MADEPNQVTPEQPAAEVPAAQAASPQVETPAADPNAELRAQYTQMQQQLQALATYVVQGQRQPPPKATEDTEETLWGRAQQGDRQAFNEYMRRIAAQETGQRLATAQIQSAVEGQLGVLYQRYPELADPQHQLSRRAVAFKQALLGMGASNTRQTDLDAILRAVADSRDILGKPMASRPNAAQTTPSHRAAPTPESHDEVRLTDRELALGRKYGVKDPKKAMAQFHARNRDGRSSVTPEIAAVVDNGR